MRAGVYLYKYQFVIVLFDSTVCLATINAQYIAWQNVVAILK